MKFCRRGRIHLATNFFDLNFLPTPNKIILSFPMSTSWREGMHELKVFSIQDWIISSTVLRPKSLFSPTTVMSDLEIGFSKNLPKCIMTSSDNNYWRNSLKYLLYLPSKRNCNLKITEKWPQNGFSFNRNGNAARKSIN